MARRRNDAVPAKLTTGVDAAQIDRLTKLVALLVVKGESQADKIRALTGAGFTNTEIADLLGTTPNAINVAIHRLRSKK